MINPNTSIIERASDKDKYNVLCAITHERYEGCLAKTGHNFWGMTKPGTFKEKWNTSYGPIPSNYNILDHRRGEHQIPLWINPDVCLVQNIFGQYQVLAPLAAQYQIPLIRLEHTASMAFWPKEQKDALKQMRGHVNVFITDWSLQSWEWEKDENTFVIYHAVDTELFKPQDMERGNYVLEVSNDYIGRDYVLNFSQFKRVVIDRKIPYKPLGDTKGFSQAPNSVNELVSELNQARIFVNTHHISPVPTSLLEAAAMECAIVSCKTCGVPEFFTHGENALLYENEKQMAEYIDLLMFDEKMANTLGKNARKIILEKCNIGRFTKQWNEVFDKARNLL